MSEMRFSDLPLSEHMLAALDEMGYENPTPVQASALPRVATGCDLMVQSQTGTGKTAAFAIPIIESLGEKPQGVHALVLCPTRELAKQVAEESGRLSRFKRVEACAVYGGASMEKQIAEMRFANIVVGTPGRVLDHLRRRTLQIANLGVLVLDEADEMLSMGFARELDEIMAFVPTKRQTLLFSATIPEDIKRYARRYMRDPEFISLIEESVGADDVEHHYYMVSGVGRPRDLVSVIEYENPESAIIFANTRSDSELVARYLKRQGFDAEYLNGDLPQRDRERIMAATKDKSLRFLVATDIAARGIDISKLSHVINYVLPESPEVYIHRTGRTGRAGEKGTAISLIGPREIGVYYYLKRIYNVALQERNVPTQAEIELRHEERRTDELAGKIVEAAGPLGEQEALLRAQSLRLLERDDAVEIMQALLKVFAERGSKRSGPQSATAGGVLSDIPRPERVAPGSRPATLESVSRSVAIMQSEFRGRPPKGEPREAASRPPAPPRDVAPPPAPVAADSTPESLTAVDGLDNGDGAPRRRRRRSEEPAPAPQADSRPEPADPVSTTAAESASSGAVDELGEGWVRLFVNVGRRDGVDEEAVREAVSDLGGLMPEDIQETDVRGRHTYIVVGREFADDLIEAVGGETLGGRTLRLERARAEND